jgi:biopolymer transport protein ExbB
MLFAWLVDGGPFMWLLLVLSIIAVAFILERGWALRRSRVIPPALVAALESSDVNQLRGACRATPSPLARLAGGVLDHLRWPKEENTSALEVKARQEVALMERGLVVLEIIVGIAPLLGLVGTLYGIIPLFSEFGKAISGDNTLLAKGIAIALNKTLAGLMVAIPALVAWSYFNKKVETLAVELEGLCDALLRRHYLGTGDSSRATASSPSLPPRS